MLAPEKNDIFVLNSSKMLLSLLVIAAHYLPFFFGIKFYVLLHLDSSYSLATMLLISKKHQASGIF